MTSHYDRCARCHDYGWTPCKCVRFEIAQAWKGKVDDGDWDETYGKEPQYLVERWAQRHDSNGDYTIVGGSEAEVWVRDEDGKVTKWTVYGEAVPEYHAREMR